jgi:hypothetical protein
MSNTKKLFVILAALVAPALAQQDQAPTPKEPAGGMERLVRNERFQGAITAKGKDGKPVPVKVALRNWAVRSGKEPLKLPEQGFMVIQLHSGKIKTTMDGKTQERHEGEFWTVPAAAHLSIEVVSETAVLQTTIFSK